jgi:hypothetical protein
MARPKKNNLDYFSHDKDMRNDIKIRNLRRKFSHKGYSVYVMMLEHLSDCEYLQYEWNELSIELLVPDFDIDSDELVDIINHCVKLKLFELELGILYCQTLYQRNDKVLTGRDSFQLINSPLSKLKRDLLSKSEINHSFPNESTYSIVKESKGEESKVKESIVQESKEQESTLKEYERTMLKDVIKSMSIPNDIKYDFVTMIEGDSTSTQRDRVFQYETTLNKVPGIKQFLETFK